MPICHVPLAHLLYPSRRSFPARGGAACPTRPQDTGQRFPTDERHTYPGPNVLSMRSVNKSGKTEPMTWEMGKLRKFVWPFPASHTGGALIAKAWPDD
jgi:hypothetical protein